MRLRPGLAPEKTSSLLAVSLSTIFATAAPQFVPSRLLRRDLHIGKRTDIPPLEEGLRLLQTVRGVDIDSDSDFEEDEF